MIRGQATIDELLTKPQGPQDERTIYDASGAVYDSPECRDGRHEVPLDRWPSGVALCGGTVVVLRTATGGLHGPCRCSCHPDPQ